VILSNLIRKKVSELPFLAKDDLVENGDDLYFCSSTCYMQFALMHRSPSISEDKVSGIIILNEYKSRCKSIQRQLQELPHIAHSYDLIMRLYVCHLGAHGGLVVKALHHKPADHRFNS
jgi:hypothetical protein